MKHLTANKASLHTSEKPFAVFDIDGTLFRWQLFHELVEELVKNQTINDRGELNTIWNDWRAGKLSFHEYEHELVKDILYNNLEGLSCKEFDKACQAVVARSGHKVHGYVKNLLLELKAQNYTIIAISGSQQELLDKFCALHGFDIAIGAMYERKDGVFTGNYSRQTIGHKAELLQDLVKARQLDFNGSLAIGDSGSDIEVLQLVEHPIAFNPSIELFEAAKQNNWSVVLERKNLAYRLEGRDNALVLAETIVL